MTEAALPPKECIERLLASMAQYEASDLHLKVGYQPYYRVQGALRATKMAPLPDSTYIEAMMEDLLPELRRAEYDKLGAVDFSAQNAAGERFRINMFCSMGDVHVSIRRVLKDIPTFAKLHLPEIYSKTIETCFEGLMLVSGVTGSGKSTTLAALVEYVNQHRSMHIVTIEDPVEFIFKSKKSIIAQREIGIDVPNCASGISVVNIDNGFGAGYVASLINRRYTAGMEHVKRAE